MKRKNNRIRFLFILAISTFTINTNAYAHLRWFVNDASQYANQNYVFGLVDALIVCGALGFILLCIYIQHSYRIKRFSYHAKLPELLPKYLEWRILAVLLGLMLTANSFMGVVVAPNIIISNAAIHTLALVVQTFTGVLFLTQLSFSLASVGMALLSLVVIISIPLYILIDYAFELIALIASFSLIGPKLCKIDIRFDKLGEYTYLALPIIRAGLGLQLMALAIHNKFMDPGLGLAFLQEYHYNFMPYLGFSNFSNLHFVFSAGVVEFTLGLLLVLGIAVRFTTFTLSLFFITTAILFDFSELIGHAPIFGIIWMLILMGSGRNVKGNPETENVRGERKGSLIVDS